MRHRLSRVKLGWVLAALGCSCASCAPDAPGAPQPTARSVAAITSGTPDTGDLAVAALVGPSGTTLCSGTVIAPHLVLTAAHCSTPDVVRGASVVFGASVGQSVATIPVVAAVAHPQFDPTTFADDIAVLVLASAAPVTAVPLGASAPDVAATVRLVGWGLTAMDAGDTGTKRQGAASVTAIAATSFDVGPAPSQPCEGDSGGPALATTNGKEYMVGVTSHGDAACVQGATYERVDAFLATFIQPTITMFAAGSAPPGANCLYPEQCAGGASTCVVASDDSSLSYCTTGCQHDTDCPAAMVCSASQCLYPAPTPGAYGAPCGSDADCLEGECTTTNVCALRCVPSAPACPTGFTCTNTADVDFFCIAPPAPPPAKGGGCALVPSGAASLPLVWIVAGALALGTRRRRARGR